MVLLRCRKTRFVIYLLVIGSINFLFVGKDESKLRHGAHFDENSSVNSSTRGAKKPQPWTKRKSRAKETEEVEICFEKRGTKEILGEIDFSSDEEPTAEDEQQVEQKSNRNEIKSIVDEEMPSTEKKVEVQRPKKGSRGRKPSKKAAESSKKKRWEANQNRTGTEPNKVGDASKNEIGARKALPKKLETKSIESSLDKLSSSKENQKPEEIRSGIRGSRTRGLTPGKKAKFEEAILLSSDSDSLDDSKESLDLPLVHMSVPSSQCVKQSCSHRVEFTSPNKTATPNSVTFKRPVKDSESMRKVIIVGRNSMNTATNGGSTCEDVPPRGDIENNENSSNGGAHRFHFHRCKSSNQMAMIDTRPSSIHNNHPAKTSSLEGSSSTFSKSNRSSSFLASASSFRPNSIPLSVNTYHVIHNLVIIILLILQCRRLNIEDSQNWKTNKIEASTLSKFGQSRITEQTFNFILFTNLQSCDLKNRILRLWLVEHQ